jgi:hypothetical protein
MMRRAKGGTICQIVCLHPSDLSAGICIAIFFPYIFNFLFYLGSFFLINTARDAGSSSTRTRVWLVHDVIRQRSVSDPDAALSIWATVYEPC